VIRFVKVPEPEAFIDTKTSGDAWLASHPEGRPPDKWSKFKPQLSDGFSELCAYSAMYEPVGTVDHFVSCDEDRSKAYEWSNYRFASGWINSSKQNLQSEEVVDPFEVRDEWFELLLPSLQLVATDQVPPEWKGRVTTMLIRLHLRDDERVIRQRHAWYRLYEEGKLTLDGLAERAPLIAAAVRKRSSQSQ
jgi:hypothetical protein